MVLALTPNLDSICDDANPKLGEHRESLLFSQDNYTPLERDRSSLVIRQSDEQSLRDCICQFADACEAAVYILVCGDPG